MSTPLIIDNDTYNEATDAIRDILLLYIELANEGRFMHNLDWSIRFDCLRFVDAEATPGSCWCDMELLRTGSSIALLCILVNCWEEMDEPGLLHLQPRHREAVEQGRLRHVPAVEAVVQTVLERGTIDLDKQWLRDDLEAIRPTHVIGFFRPLIET